MTLAPGTRLGPYEIHSAIGAGGMGEVYRARDTRLHRDVAIKVLPELLASDADRLARFEREAQILAQLNHPNIAAIYGLEEGQGRRALVLEFVDGPTLADRITQGSLPLDEALPIAKQIAHALEAAHEHGIVHRDLKPANIKLRPDGTVKVLDFGLAKAFESAAVDAGLSISPTITSPAMMTGAGVILGTAAYMSPEQARGRAVDKRTDIWAFGCVFFEMLTATRAFGGDNVTDVVAAIVRGEPPWKLLPPHTPLRIVELLRRCLEKDPHTRLRDIGDARWEIEASQRDPGAGTPTAEPDRRSTTWLVPAAATFGLLVGVAATMGWVTRTSSAPAPQTVLPLARTVIDLPASAPLAVGTVIPDWGFDSPALALSPNGRYLAYVGQSTSGTMLYLRELASFNVKPLPGSEGAFYAFFAPDSSSVGFLTNDKVKKVSLDAGSAVTLCDAVQPVTATWAQDDTIYFSEDQGGRISSVPAGGGASTAVRTAPPSGRFSQVLPDGRSALITISDRSISDEYGEIAVVSLTERSVAPKVLVSSAYDGRYVGPGYLLFGRGGSLFAVRFDAARQDVIGEPAQVTSGVSMESLFGQVHAAASDNGLIAFVPGGERAIGRLAWVDRAGQTEYLDAPARVYGMLDLAPDGSKIAVHVADVTDYLWLYDILRKEGRRFTAGEASGWPVWGADSQSLVFSAWQSLSERRVSSRTVDDGTVGRELVGVGVWAPYTWSPDGRVLGASAGGRGGFFSISDGVKRGELFGEMPHFSPDGRWVVYSSTDVGRSEILVRSYPDGNITRQISVDGGLEPVWCACGELFFRKGNQWLSSAVRTEATLTWDPPRPVFLTDFVDTPGRSYDVSPDGKRLLVVKRAEPDITSRIHLVVNWSAQFPR